MSVEQAIAPVPGWYTDPSDAANMRWWSGAGWTDHVAPVPVQQASHPPTADVPSAAPVASAAASDETAPATRRDGGAAVGVEDAADADSPAPADNWWIPARERAGAVEQSTVSSRRPAPRPLVADTSAAWKLAFIPLFVFAVSAVLHFVAPMFGFEGRYSLGLLLATLIVAYRTAKSDREELTSRGLLTAPHPAWVLLGVFSYLAVRFYRVSRAGGVKAAGPFWAALLSTVGQVVLSFLVAFAAVTLTAGQSLAPGASEVSAVLEREMLAAGYDVAVTCPEGADYTAGSAFSCAVSDPAGVMSSVDVTAIAVGEEIYYRVTSAG